MPSSALKQPPPPKPHRTAPLVPHTTLVEPDPPTPARASTPISIRRPTIVLMPVTISDVPRPAFSHDDRLQALPSHAGFQRRLRRDPPVARLVEIGQFAPVVHDEQHVVVPQPPEVAA